MDLRKLSLLAGLVLACSALSIALTRVRRGSAIPTVGVPTRDASLPVDASYGARVQPIFDRRCVVCHACFDAPCQLNLQAFEGVDRGANKTPVYNPSRLDGISPTRLFRDALTTGDWQQRFGFFPVLSRVESKQLSGSLIWRLIKQRRQKPLGGVFDVDSSATCPASLDELKRELAARPELGMPFGFPPLSDSEADTLAAWLKAGSPRPPAAPEATGDEAAAIERWEAFLNADDPRSQLVARYLFEHLFFAHL
ncbi:MAG TPA: fatty acid cis/trans isomerase, partial [Polyangiaceae bacterium]